MASFRFLQFSDLHIGRSLEGSGLNLDRDQQETLRSERLDALESIVDVAIEEGVEVVFLPGDLFEEDRVDTEEIQRIRRAFETLQSIPVVITPGNHDYDSRLSWYRPDVMRKHQLEPWPDNVHIFSSSSFETRRIPGLDALRVTGFAYRRNRRMSEWPDAPNLDREEDVLDVLLIHGSLSSVLPPGKMNTLPVTEEQIREHPADYVAMGHYHDVYTIEEDHWVRGAYSGSPLPVTDSDTGNRYVLLGELTESGVATSAFERRDVGLRRLMEVSIDGQKGESASAFRRRLHDQLVQNDVRERDLVRLHLRGEHPGEDVLGSEEIQSFFDQYFHVEPDLGQAAPSIYSELDRGETEEPVGTTEQQFVRELQKRIDEASSEQQKEILTQAMRMGLSAFRREEVELSDVL